MLFLIKKFFKFIFRLVLILAVLVIIVFIAFNWPVRSKNDQMEFHVSFSDIYAESLGLDWKRTYQAILEDLKPRKIRIAAYWDQIEKILASMIFLELTGKLKKPKKGE